jgi:hypothetical protein
MQARDEVLDRLETDLIGPHAGAETLEGRPSDVYLSGILWPWETRMGDEEAERLGLGDDDSGAGEAEELSLAGLSRPCSAGVSFAVASTGPEPAAVVFEVRCGTYRSGGREQAEGSPHERSGKGALWTRRDHDLVVGPLSLGDLSATFDLSSSTDGLVVEARTEHGVPAGLHLHVRTARWQDCLLVTATLLNKASPGETGREELEKATLFQVGLSVRPHGESVLVARPVRRAIVDDEDRNLALLYRDAKEFAVGHTCAATWTTDASGRVGCVSSTWLPRVTVKAVRPVGHKLFEELLAARGGAMSARWLATAAPRDLEDTLLAIVETYRSWIGARADQLASLDIAEKLRDEGRKNLENCSNVAARMEAGAKFLSRDATGRLAFQLANLAMQVQYEWTRNDGEELRWRPFQLGFVLLSAASVAQREHPDRGVMDLLWFPTGGGKTEAYLCLTAFTAFYRRLSPDAPDQGAGVAALMRYTLRLLTTQQFARAAAMILACEALRRRTLGGVPPDCNLGEEPFSIGLWVGSDATPNSFEKAKASLDGDTNLSSPKQLQSCPCCGKVLRWRDDGTSRAILVTCPSATEDCALGGDTPLPVWTVDEDIYRRRPTLVLGTVDKFAQVVRKSEINSLFAVSAGRPPDLVIQDELHLISGPLGTIAGLYETIIDGLFSREGVGPKVIGSTATIRRASQQVLALFDRDICQFPPPGITSTDSGFAFEDPDETKGRLYAGVTTAGRSAKFSLQAVAASLLQSGEAAFADNATRDPYWTLVNYFNSLRELGGALVLMQDDVRDAVELYARLRAEDPRQVKAVEELTSRRTQDEILEMLDMLQTRAGADGALDAVLASNMLSVGVDVPRLGLMLVNGQPKGIAEYIQATSRVGRRHPGVVVTVLNNGKPRDRSHFETFRTWHSTLYRDVEATSVTPFASRARDRALHAVLVGLVRHTVPGMLGEPDLTKADPVALARVVDAIVERAKAIDEAEGAVRRELEDQLDRWMSMAPKFYWKKHRFMKGALLQDAERVAELRALGRSPGASWPTLNTMRNVEPSTSFLLREHLAPRNRTHTPRKADGE